MRDARRQKEPSNTNDNQDEFKNTDVLFFIVIDY